MDKMTKCDVCGTPCNHYMMCDEDTKMVRYCMDCFVKTGCFKGHDEGCSTHVFESHDDIKPASTSNRKDM